MKIIIEGADGAGKTTLAKILADKYGLEICHCTQHDPADFYFYRETLRKENCIWDRHTIGELIYPLVFNREAQITQTEAKAIIDIAKSEGVKIFVLTAPIETLYERLRKRVPEENPRILANLSLIDGAFVECARAMGVPVINTANMTLNEIFELVEGKRR